MVIIDWVLVLAPLGVFALAFTVGSAAGGAAFAGLGHYVVIISLIGVIVTLAAYPLASFVGRIGPHDFARGMIGPQTVAISTRSSLASLPAMLTASRDMGIRENVADVTLADRRCAVPRDRPGDEHRGRFLRRSLARN